MACSESISKTRELLERLAEQDGSKDRSALLALLELEKRARLYNLSTGMCCHPSHLVSDSSLFLLADQTDIQWLI